ncbi:CDGSH iron-sulfur domain-containing protein [Nocardia sp. NPDC050378]|uniref:CDGSH iron-sulfur domain-containing protein n=1 Tax=Nocardia sp. NPDC050378 TaxID=3155400 RepID=UPI0033DC6A43
MSNETAAPPSGNPPDRRRVVLTDGPALIEGPVDLVTREGTVLHCDRFQVALCLCKRSATYPLCDTSHRRRRRRTNESST